jgi:hypothetical protein
VLVAVDVAVLATAVRVIVAVGGTGVIVCVLVGGTGVLVAVRVELGSTVLVGVLVLVEVAVV